MLHVMLRHGISGDGGMGAGAENGNRLGVR